MCDLEGTGTPSVFKLIRKTVKVYPCQGCVPLWISMTRERTSHGEMVDLVGLHKMNS